MAKFKRVWMTDLNTGRVHEEIVTSELEFSRLFVFPYACKKTWAEIPWEYR